MPPKHCPEHEPLTEDVAQIKLDTAETKKSVELIIKNHLPHLKKDIKWLFWLVAGAATFISIIIGAGLAIIAVIVQTHL